MLTPDKAIEKLIDGNRRFANNEAIHPNIGQELRDALVNGQRPYAAILACSDSRVPVEIIFDAGLGDLFVVRTAGQVLSKEVLGSLEYAVSSLGVKLIVVLGHDNCGAVTAAYKYYQEQDNTNISENLQAVLNHIYPTFDKLTAKDEENVLKDAVKENIKHQVNDIIQKSPLIADKIKNNQLAIHSALYNLSTCKMDIQL